MEKRREKNNPSQQKMRPDFSKCDCSYVVCELDPWRGFQSCTVLFQFSIFYPSISMYHYIFHHEKPSTVIKSNYDDDDDETQGLPEIVMNVSLFVRWQSPIGNRH
jgi:hypothetical protein